MPDLLLELRSEEIPARMQRKAAGDLRKLVTDGLVEAGLTYEAAREYWTPRRLALDIRGVTARSRDVREERKGPSTKAPDAAIQGFLRSAGLASVSDAHVHSDPKKGDFYVAHLIKPGRSAEDILAELIPSVIRGFPWPKSMRWGPASARPGSLRWVRPLQSILCTFGPETEEPVVVDFDVDGIRSGNVTVGHRFHAPGAIVVRRFDDYVAKLEAAKVVLDAERRKAIIQADAANLAFAAGLELVEDEGLLEEVSGLVEWPVVALGEFEAEFLAIPAEVIRLTIRANQKCFVTRPSSDSDGALANRFVLTANIMAADGGAEIARGNGKVVRARLSDALYFWNTDQADLPDLDQLKASAERLGLDLAKPLDQRMARLDHLAVTFHAKLGTQGQRVERIRRLAEELAPIVGANLSGGGSDRVEDWPISPLAGEMSGKTEGGAVPQASPLSFLDNPGGPPEAPPSALPGISPARGEISQSPGLASLAARAAVLAKADLTTEIVGEFPELQGTMGRKYALLQGEHLSVAAAIEEHYKPQGPSDRVPTNPVSIAVALADKLDTLVGFWAIDEKPTGSKDPYALRRAALGVVRLVVENGISIRLLSGTVWDKAVYNAVYSIVALRSEQLIQPTRSTLPNIVRRTGPEQLAEILVERINPEQIASQVASNLSDLLSFFHERLKVYLRDQGARHDLIDAVLAGGGEAPLISRLAGEMSAKPTEGGAVPRASPFTSSDNLEDPREAPPSALSGSGASHGSRPSFGPPARGEIGQSRNDDLLEIVQKVQALGAFFDTDAGKNLLAGTKRAVNILAAEEKKGTEAKSFVDEALFAHPAERKLSDAVNLAESQAAQAIQAQRFSAALQALSALREPVDAFFEAVLVNDEDAAVRANRLALLGRIRAATGQVADFSKIAG